MPGSGCPTPRLPQPSARIPPSSQHMFEGDHNQLSKVVELCKDLSATAERPYNQRTRERTSLLQLSDPTINTHPRLQPGSHGKGGGGGGASKADDKEKDKKSWAGRGKYSFRGGRLPEDERIRSSSNAFKDKFCSASSDQGWLRLKDTISDIHSSERICGCGALQAHPRVGSGDQKHHPSAGQGQCDSVQDHPGSPGGHHGVPGQCRHGTQSGLVLRYGKRFISNQVNTSLVTQDLRRTVLF